MTTTISVVASFSSNRSLLRRFYTSLLSYLFLGFKYLFNLPWRTNSSKALLSSRHSKVVCPYLLWNSSVLIPEYGLHSHRIGLFQSRVITHFHEDRPFIYLKWNKPESEGDFFDLSSSDPTVPHAYRSYVSSPAQCTNVQRLDKFLERRMIFDRGPALI